jgi:hypothetical protein
MKSKQLAHFLESIISFSLIVFVFFLVLTTITYDRKFVGNANKRNETPVKFPRIVTKQNFCLLIKIINAKIIYKWFGTTTDCNTPDPEESKKIYHKS